MARQMFRYKHNRLQQLRGFYYAAKTRSMSKAGDLLDLSQPSISLQIKALEKDLNAVLFVRQGPRIELTHDGRTLFQLSAELVEGFETLEKKFASQRDSIDHGHLDIAAGGSTLQYILPQFVEKFTQKHPGINLKLHNVTGRDGLVLLKDGQVDFCIGPLLDIPDDIEFHPIVTYDPVLITQKGHPLTKRKHINLKSISKYPLILPPRHLSTWRQVEIIFAQHGLPYEVKLEVGGWEVIKRYVELGMGVSIVMSICIEGDENLAVMPIEKYFPKRTYGIVLRKGKYISPQSQGFIDHLLAK